jgi:hypothetical protein
MGDGPAGWTVRSTSRSNLLLVYTKKSCAVSCRVSYSSKTPYRESKRKSQDMIETTKHRNESHDRNESIETKVMIETKSKRKP